VTDIGIFLPQLVKEIDEQGKPVLAGGC